MAHSYACFASSKEDQCFGFIVLAPNPDTWIGRFVHFDPFQIGTQSTQFCSCLSSTGICSKRGRMNFGGGGTPVLASVGPVPAGPVAPVAPAAPMLRSCVCELSILPAPLSPCTRGGVSASGQRSLNCLRSGTHRWAEQRLCPGVQVLRGIEWDTPRATKNRPATNHCELGQRARGTV